MQRDTSGRQSDMYHSTPETKAEEEVCIEGTLERVVFESGDTGFVVARFQEEGKPSVTTVVGSFLAVSAGETLRLWGRWVEDKRYGRQLRVSRYQTLLPTSVKAIEKYLGSGLVTGIGPVYAKRLVAAFGVETLRVIEEEPQKLRRVEGIGSKRAALIRGAWTQQKAIQSIMLFLQGRDIGLSQAVKIYKQYGDKAVAVLRENPYRLAIEIKGIGFKSADGIAKQMGVEPTAPQRIQSGMLHVLDEAASQGNTFLPLAELEQRSAALLDVPEDLLPPELTMLIADNQVVRDGDAIFPRDLHHAEKKCARYLRRLLELAGVETLYEAEKAIEWVERREAISLSDGQREALRQAALSRILIVTGGPGTGKTTLLRSLIGILKAKKQSVVLAAPTGRAAKRMMEATAEDARTLHRLLEFSPKSGGFLRHEGNPIEADIIIIDECSMVDVTLMHMLMKAVPPEARLIFVGDVDQLPSVGPGNVLMDLISSNIIPTVWLKTVFRQASESGIVVNAHHINEGKYPAFNTSDFIFLQRKAPQDAVATILELVTERLPKKFGYDSKRDVQVLAPMHRGDAGVGALNEALQNALNPGGKTLGRRAFRVQDKVMQTRNNYELDVYNGDVGYVASVDDDTGEAVVQFDAREVVYDVESLDDLSLAYAMTVHKAQGSEYPVVILPLLTQHYPMLQRNVFYTAITRAGKMVITVGDVRAVRRAVMNADVAQRHTRLAEYLRG